jgi:ketosteroid isomerase-like protein
MGTPSAPGTGPGLARSPEACDRLFAERLNAADLDGLLGLYEPTAALVQRDGALAVGAAEIGAALGRLVAMRPRIEVDIVRVVQAAEGLAMVYNDWRMIVPGPAGPVERTGRAIEVMRRHADGGWRVVLDDPYARG